MKQKLKTKRGAKKRFKVTGTGKVKASKANRRHILSSKPPKRKRQMRRKAVLKAADTKTVHKMLLK